MPSLLVVKSGAVGVQLISSTSRRAATAGEFE
jgi:hypothetical protein